jgi:hypothetical protein
MTHAPSAASGKTLDELRRVVVNLPMMPKSIVDDTRHEKVLSYVSAFIAQGDPTLMHTMLCEWAILDIFQVRGKDLFKPDRCKLVTHCAELAGPTMNFFRTP